MTVDRAEQWRRVSPLPCLPLPLLGGAPAPAQPPVRAVCPRTAGRPAASPLLRRVRHGRAHAAAHGGAPPRLPLAVRHALPSDTPALPSLGHVPTKTAVAATLEPSERLAGGGVPAVVAPPVPMGCPLSPHAFGLIGARRDVPYCRRFRLVWWADVAGNMARACWPLPGRLRCPTLTPRPSTPAGSRVTRLLARGRGTSIRVALPSKAARPG